MARDEDEDENDDDRPRKKRSRDDEDEDENDDDRPRKKRSRDDEDDDRLKKQPTEFPGRLFAAAALSVAWGGLNLHRGCLAGSNALFVAGAMMKREARPGGLGGGGMMPMEGTGLAVTIGITTFLMLLLAAILFAGGILLAMRKGFAQYMAMGVPAVMAVVALIGFAICAFLMREGGFAGIAFMDVLTGKFSGYVVDFALSLAVGGANAYLLLNKSVKKALK